MSKNRMVLRFSFLSLIVVVGFSARAAKTSLHPARPNGTLALVYEGPGSCDVSEGDCTKAAETAAINAGYEVKRIGPDALKPGSTEADYQTIFGNASIWIQPGGHSAVFLNKATPELKSAIKRFVDDGAGYVGFCAGAFSATTKDGGLDLNGLGVFPGKTYPYPNQTMDTFFDSIASTYNDDAVYNQILEVNWLGKTRHLYFEEGAVLNLDGIPNEQVEVIATYKNGQTAAARTHFGKGKVYITGAHPEAPLSWRTHPDLVDPDGLDYDLVKDMLDWVNPKTVTKAVLK